MFAIDGWIEGAMCDILTLLHHAAAVQPLSIEYTRAHVQGAPAAPDDV